ncbi:hypothetical protein GCM10008969_33690 [Pseudomonas veronii subsp. inensis]|uniref:hypothetical protein n=1 Tax=Pseudomonas veronii TaxID=76761 RepID=UPI0031F83188
MPLHVFTGPRESELQAQGIDATIITGNACTTIYLVDRIQQQAKAGAPYFLADDCTRAQIKAVQNIELPEQFTVYLVRQA